MNYISATDAKNRFGELLEQPAKSRSTFRRTAGTSQSSCRPEEYAAAARSADAGG